MNIVHIATIDTGGAYKGAIRLSESLNSCGVASLNIVRTKLGKDENVFEAFSTKLQQFSSRLKNGINLFKKRKDLHIDYIGSNLADNRYIQDADIVIIHWINSFLSPRDIARICTLNKPVIWLLHDMWPFTGGCHVSLDCNAYQIGCGNCPQLHSKDPNDITARYLQYKQKILGALPITFIGPSRWIVDCASKSLLLKDHIIEYIPNTINTDLFKPLKNNKHQNTDKRTILFGAADSGSRNRNKGFNYLVDAILKLPKEKYRLAIFGNSLEITELREYEIIRYGYIENEDDLIRIYNEADVFVNPSLQESFGYTVCEAMACGIPVVAFSVGGHLDQIEHKKNGYLVEVGDVADLAQGIEYCISHREQLGRAARESTLKFSYESIGRQYLNLLKTKVLRDNSSMI